MSEKAIVYVVDCVGSNYFKVGITNGEIESRIAQLQTGCPFELKLRCFFETDTPRELEKFLHDSLSVIRIRGEWFEKQNDIPQNNQQSNKGGYTDKETFDRRMKVLNILSSEYENEDTVSLNKSVLARRLKVSHTTIFNDLKWLQKNEYICLNDRIEILNQQENPHDN